MYVENPNLKCIIDILVSSIISIGVLIVFLVASGSGQDAISITVPTIDTNWNVDPITEDNIQHGTLIVNSTLPWSVTVSSDLIDGQPAEYDLEASDYAVDGSKLQNPMKIKAVGGNEVNLSAHGGVLIEGVGNMSISVSFEQPITWQDEPLHNGHVYHMEVSFIATQEEGCIPPSIDTFDVAPLERQVVPGETATLKVGASGSGLTYQWFKGHGGGEATYAYTPHQYYDGYGIYGATLLKDGGHISGANTSTLKISDFDCSDNGTYLIIVSNLCGFDYDSTSLNEYYSLSVQPENQWVLEGETATFSAIVDCPVDSYQWQTSSDLYATYWSDITNNPTATTSTLSFTATTADDMRWFRVVVTKGGCSWISDWWGRLTVGFSGPDDQAVLGWGEIVQFSVYPSDTQIFSYQWQVSDVGATFIDINGATDPTYSFTTSNVDNGRKYRVLVTDKASEFSKPSREAVIHNYIVGPQDQTVGVCEGGVSLAYFSVKPASDGYDYTWYRSVSGGWEEVYGSNTWNYEYQADILDNNRRFYVHIKNLSTGLEGDSNQAILTVYNKPCISTQTYMQTVCSGGTATFNVDATGDSLSYHWFKVTSQGSETQLVDLPNRISGSNTNTLTISNVESSDAAAYYVLIRGLHDSTAASDTATLTVGLPSITGPSDETVCEGSYVDFGVEPYDEYTYDYKWESSEAGGQNWEMIDGATHPYYEKFNVDSSDNGKMYHVIVSGSSLDCSETSRAATLTVTSQPDLKISLESNPNPVKPGEDLNYIIGYVNKGCTDTNAYIDVSYDPHVQFVSADQAPDSGTDHHWTLGDLGYGDSGTIRVTVRVPYSTPNGILSSYATLSSDNGATPPAYVSTEVKSDATLLYINKEASAQVIFPGSYLDYAINYQNRGGSTLHNVTVNDTVDKHLQFEAATPPPTRTQTDNEGTHLWWSAADLGSQSMPPGGSQVIMLRAYLPDVLVYPNFDSVYNNYDASSNEMKGNFNTLETFVVHSLWIKKTADKEVYSQGEVVNYTITYGNDEQKPVDFNNVVIEDDLPDLNYTEYLSASPQPDSINGNVLLWNIGTLGHGQSGTIQLYVKRKENCSEISYKSSGSVSGVGFANIRQNIDTAQNPDHLTNYVKIYDTILGELHSASATIKLADALGTAVNINGHGSGTYTREDQTQMLFKNRSIQVKTSLSENYHSTSFALPLGRSIKYSSKWSEAQTGKNRITGATLSEVYMYANRINRDSTINLDKNGSTLASETSFEGAGHINVVKKEGDNPKVAPTYESHEDYLGSFKVNTNVDEYGKNVVSNRSVSGTGMAASDKRIKKSQRSYESGTGAYLAEERTDTLSSYMAKEFNVIHEPVSYTYTPDVRLNLSQKWKEGMWSRSGSLSLKGSNSSVPASFIGEEFSDANFLNVSTVAPGLNEMNTEAEFSGRAEFKAAKEVGNSSGEKVALYDEYIGRYRLSRKMMISGVARFDMPHLYISKVGRLEPPEGIVGSHAGSSTVSYTITVENDGNRALGPVYVTDLFPPETEYVSSSARPAELGSDHARWTLISLGIGASIQIELKLKAREGVEGLVNRVQADGAYTDQWVSAQNFSVIQINFQSCCPSQMLVTKQGSVDPSDAKLIHYNITLQNRRENAVVATIDDQLPQGMAFIGSSVPPSNVSSTSNTVRWNLIEIRPGENKTIDYRCRAQWGGRFENLAHVDAYSLDGADLTSTDVISSVFVEGEGYRSSSTWQPPACFGLNCTQPGFENDWMACVSCGAQEPETAAPQAGQTCPACSGGSGDNDGYDIP